ncbi:MAG: FkbM family methyltransferase [Cellvibrionales bacterium]|jgi:FkbM family methyltransferase|nr:FkbM family methyltransferase [Cellvibrionales bacterium]
MKIFDIGANIGAFTDANLKLYPESDFLLIEANPDLFKKLSKKFSNRTNVLVKNYCVSNINNDRIKFHLSKHDTISTASTEWVKSSRFPSSSFYKTIEVDSISIDNLIIQYGDPDFIKIDVEGYESTVLSGLSKNVCRLSFEWAEESQAEILKSLKHLNEIGYKEFFVKEEESFSLSPPSYNSYSDVVDFIKSLIPSRKEKWGMIFAA